MAHQASVNGGPRVRINSPILEGVVGNLAEFGNDITSLAELQAKLTVLDMKEAAVKAAVPAVGLGGAAALGLGAVPILLFGVAQLITTYLGLKLGWSLLIVALAAFATAGLVGWLCWSGVSASLVSFRRSREELARNVAWVKTVLAYSGRPAPHRKG